MCVVAMVFLEHPFSVRSLGSQDVTCQLESRTVVLEPDVYLLSLHNYYVQGT